MKGPEHYAEAERLSHASGAAMLAAFEEPAGGAIDRVHLQTAEAYAARAQVHATLALAAATALGMSDGVGFEGMRAGDAEAWEAVCSVIADRGPVAPGVPEGHVHDGCEEHYTEPGACCPHCPGWAV